MNSQVFIHIHQGCFAGTGAIVRLPQCQWSKPDGYGKISQCITTTKHSKAKTVCIFLGTYCRNSHHIDQRVPLPSFVCKCIPLSWKMSFRLKWLPVYACKENHYIDIIMSTMASQITSPTIVYSTVHSGTDERKHQSSVSLAFVRGIHRWLVNSLHKGPVTQKMFPFDDIIMQKGHFIMATMIGIICWHMNEAFLSGLIL